MFFVTKSLLFSVAHKKLEMIWWSTQNLVRRCCQ